MSILLAALAPLVSPPQATATVLLREGMTLPDGRTLSAIQSGPLLDGVTGGYFVMLRVDGAALELWHDPDGIGPAPLGLYHVPTGPPNHIVVDALLLAAGSDRVAWVLRTERTTLGITVSFSFPMVDQERAWRPTDPSPIAGTTWIPSSFFNMAFNELGELLFRGSVETAAGVPISLIANLDAQEVVMRSGDPVLGSGAVIQSVGTMRTSPNGRHLGVAVTTGISPCFNGSSTTWPILDGAALTFRGQRIRTTMTLPDGVGAASGEFVNSASIASVSDSGQAAVSLGYGPACSFLNTFLYVRGDDALTGDGQLGFPRGLSSDGLAVQESGVEMGVEGRPVAGAASPVDVDGDGMADPGWMLHDVGVTEVVSAGYRVTALDRIYGRVRIRPTGGEPVDAFVHIEDSLVGDVYCASFPNSTGRIGTLEAIGSTSVGRNDLSLVAHRLPYASFGYVLVSTTPAVIAQPGNSQGVLCLGGSIGRFAGDVFNSGDSGSAVTHVDLAALPQPMGTAAAMAGEVWRFQAWHRDVIGGLATSNFTDAIEVTLR